MAGSARRGALERGRKGWGGHGRFISSMIRRKRKNVQLEYSNFGVVCAVVRNGVMMQVGNGRKQRWVIIAN